MNSQGKSWLANIIAILVKDIFATKQTTAPVYLTERIPLVSLIQNMEKHHITEACDLFQLKEVDISGSIIHPLLQDPDQQPVRKK
jgi:hypothetical protein